MIRSDACDCWLLAYGWPGWQIISDIRDVQKEINLVSETLTRTEALADEKIFQEANKPEGRRDPAMVQVN